MTNLVVLRLYKNGELVEVKQFQADQIVVGRSVDAQMIIDDDGVSPLHAVIEKRDAGYFISDLGSETGTLKDGDRVLEQALTSGDEFQIGDYTLQFFIGVPKGASPPAKSKPTPTGRSGGGDQQKESAAEVKDQPQTTEEQPPSVETISQGQAFAEKVAGSSESQKQKSSEPAIPPKGTFAPESSVSDLKSILKPEKGTVVEVVVAWKERVIDTYHFNDTKNIYIGSDNSCDIVVPILGTSITKHKMISIDSLAHVFVNTTMTGEYIEGGKSSKTFGELSRTEKMHRQGDYYQIDIAQGDMLVVTFAGGQISLYIRYVSETPLPIMAPLLDLTASEVTGVILAVVVAAIFGLYMMVYAPEQLEDDSNKAEEPIRLATIKFQPPKPKEIVKVGAETKKKVVEVKKVEKKAPPSAKTKGKTGATTTLKPKSTQKKTTTYSGQRQKGGAVKTGKKSSNAQSKKKDPTSMGILSAFGGKGTQKQLSKVYDGSGGLIGLADQATGTAGFEDDRPGENLGGRLKSTGAGGKGKSSVGISGPITKGKGSGAFGYGQGGIGKKGSVQINIGGQEEAFVGTIDREAIRRVILDNLNQIRHCYERQLNKNPDMFGKLVLQWDIIDRGRVRNTIVKKNTLGNREVAKCVVNRLKRWRFPEPPEDQVARVTYPFVFASK